MPPNPEQLLSIARALLDASPGPQDPPVQAAKALLLRLGYDLPNAASAARANEQLMRTRASGLLAEGAQALVKLEATFRTEKVPPSTSQQPFPPAEAMRTLRQLDGLRRRLHDLSSAVITLEAPPSDHIWTQLRGERDLLERLLAADVSLGFAAQDVASAAGAASVSSVSAQLPAIEAAATAMDQVLRERRALVSTLV